MKIWTLVENTACRADCTAEHGLSLYIETGDHRILFDAGQSGAFADNAEKMGVDLSKVDFAVLSHGHYDHGGGLLRFLERNTHAPIYVNQYALGAHFNGAEKYIGLPPELAQSGRLIFAQETQVLAPGITLHSCNTREKVCRTEPFGLQIRRNGRLEAEDFLHEQYLLIREDQKQILFSGCSHKGIVNIAAWFCPDVLIGGFHLNKLDPGDGALEAVAARLKACPTVYYTGHCTGKAQYDVLKTVLGHRLEQLSAGKQIQL